MKDYIVVDGKTYYTEGHFKSNYKVGEQLDWLKSEITQQLSNAKALYDDFKDKELTVSTIEAEGFLRASLQIHGTMEYIASHFTEENQ